MSSKGDRHNKAQESRMNVVRGEDLSIKGEAEYIVGGACKGEARFVTLGPLIFFSTDTCDAWMLDRKDGLAVCLARGGERQAYSICESASGYAIEWNGRFELLNETFVYADNAGNVRSVLGYPMAEIRRALG